MRITDRKAAIEQERVNNGIGGLYLSEDLMYSIRNMTDEIVNILSANNPSVYLYGSVALDDFQFGWSDIDILVLTEKQMKTGLQPGS